MNQTDLTLLEQMRITDFEVDQRKLLFSFAKEDADLLASFKPAIENVLDALVNAFYLAQTSNSEVALVIGDADTLARLRNAQHQYVLGLFGGHYGLEYVNNRLRIGLVHKRIGVEPKLYLSAIHALQSLIRDMFLSQIKDPQTRLNLENALNKLFMFDVSLVFETYIRSLVSEIETAKNKAEVYARNMEEKVKERTAQLEELSRTDPLTGLLNVRHLNEIITKILRSAQRRSEPVSVAYIDVNDFKKFNDEHGHLKGDQILKTVGHSIKKTARHEDVCVRYGGDEFCVVLVNCPEESARENFAERLNEAVFQELGGEVSLSIGVVQTGPKEYLDAQDLIRKADEKMYASKKATKNSLSHQPTLAIRNSA